MCAKCGIDDTKVTKLDFVLEVAWMIAAIYLGLTTESYVIAYIDAIFFVVLLSSVCDKAKAVFA
jgi:hypothetical protein